MDAAQFQQFLALQQQNFQNLIQQLTSQQDASPKNVQAPHNAAIIYNFENFDKNKEDFLQYLERFENYLTLKGIKTEEQTAKLILLNSIGAEYYELLKVSCAPKEISALTYHEVIEILKSQLSIKINVIVERHRFLSTKQESSQTINEYVNQLRKFSANCQFNCECGKSVADLFLQSQFIRGIYDQSIREKLLAKDDLAFPEALKEAQALEASKINNKELSSSSTAITSSDDVNRITKFRRENARPFRGDSNSKNFQNDSRYRKCSKSRINLKQLGLEGVCLHCGRSNHTANKCRVKSWKLKCNCCHKNGHIERVCIKKLLQSKSNIKIVDDEENISNVLDNCNNCQVIDIYGSQSSKSQETQKYFVNVKIEGKSQRFEVDSGAGHTLLPLSEFKRHQIDAKLQSTSIRFRSYTAGIFAPIGSTEVHVEYNNIKSKEILFVVPNQFSAILGRSWIRHLNISLQDLDHNKQSSIQDSCVSNINSVNVQNSIFSNYAEIFEQRIGCASKYKCSLKLRENAKPVAHKCREIPFSLKTRVQARWYTNNKPSWRFGSIIRKFGKLHYLVQLDGDNYTLKRHIDQLRFVTVSEQVAATKTSPQKKNVTFARPLERNRPTAEIFTPNQVINGDPVGVEDRREVPRELPQLPVQENPRRSERIRRPPTYLRDYIY